MPTPERHERVARLRVACRLRSHGIRGRAAIPSPESGCVETDENLRAASISRSDHLLVPRLRAPTVTRAPVAVIGAGLIGRSWAVCFARAGFQVRLHDTAPGAAESALRLLRATLDDLAARDLLDGQDPSAIAARVTITDRLAAALDGATHIQENTPEKLDVKRAVFAELAALADPDAVLASSTSALLPSTFTQGLDAAPRCLVAHPLNPPHLIPAVEIVPSPVTDPKTVETTRALMAGIGQTPIVLAREVDGFVVNRLQGALLDEAVALVASGICTVDEIDIAIRDGLARRWSFIGPFETIDLNAPAGIADYFDRYGEAYAAIGAERPARHPWTGDLAARITAERRALLPAERLSERQSWRDRRLAALSAHLDRGDDT